MVPGVLKKVVPVQARDQEGLEVEVLQVNRVDQVGPKVRPRIPIEITLTVDRGLFVAKEESNYDMYTYTNQNTAARKNCSSFFILIILLRASFLAAVFVHNLSKNHIAIFNSLYFCTFWNHETTSQNYSDEAKYSNNLHTSLEYSGEY